MLKCFIILLGGLCFLNTKAQTAATCDSAKYVSAYSSDSLLERSLQDYYSKGHFNKLLRKYGVKKITCAGCDAVFVELAFTIDANGKIVPVEVKNSVLCHRERQGNFIADFYASLKPLTVPLQFAGKCFVYRFGRALKC